MSLMNKTIWITLYVLTGGFGVLELFAGQPQNAGFWFLLLALCMAARALLEKKKGAARKDPALSVLDPQTAEALSHDQLTPCSPQGLVLRRHETCYLQVPASLDFYDVPQGLLTLTDQRIFFVSETSRFISDWEQATLRRTKRGFEMQAGKRKMPFVSSETATVLKVYSLLQKQRKKGK